MAIIKNRQSKQQPEPKHVCRNCGREIKYNVLSETCAKCASKFKVYDQRIERHRY